MQEPITDSILVATGTGIAPMRGYTQWLFPEDGPDRSNGKDIWLVYGTRYETDIYYREEFEALAARKPNFHYLPTLSRAQESWTGLRGYVQDHVARIVEERAARLGLPLPAARARSDASPATNSTSTSTPTSAASTTWSRACAICSPASAGIASKSSSSATTRSPSVSATKSGSHRLYEEPSMNPPAASSHSKAPTSRSSCILAVYACARVLEVAPTQIPQLPS